MANGNTIISLVLKAKDEASGVLSGATAKIMGLVAAFGGGVAVKETLESLSEMDKVTQRLSMSAEELSKGHYAAYKLAGIGVEEYNDALTEVRIKMEEWSSINSGGATDFFEIMKVDAQEFMKLNPQDQFLKIAETMKDMSDSARFTFLDQIGSDVLRNLLPAIKDGGEEFKNMIREAEKLGVITSSFDTKAVSALNREIGMLSKTASTTFQKAFSSVAPELTAIVEVVRDRMTDMLGYVNDNKSGITTAFQNVIVKVLQFVDKLSVAGTSSASLFLTVRKKAIEFSKDFVSAFQTISNGVGKVWAGVVNTTNKAMADISSSIADKILPLAAEATNMFGFDDKANQIRGLSAQMRENAEELRKSMVEYKPLDTSAVQGFLDKELQKTKELIELEKNRVKTEGESLGLADLYLQKIEERRSKLSEAVKEQDEANKSTLAKGGDAKFGAANATSAAAIASSQAKLRADLARADIESTIQTIETKKELELAGLDERARLEGLSANKISDLRLEIELEAAQKINEQRRKSIDEDIKELQVQIEGQRSILSQEASDAGRGGAAAAIAELEAEITRKKREQVALNGELVNQSALLKANRAAELGTLKAELKEINEQAKLELRIIRGDSVNVELERLEKEWGQTVKDMEELGLESDTVKNLLSAKKAEVELNDIESQFESLKKKLEKRKISPFEYLNKVGELEEKGAGKAEEVGDPDRLEAFQEAAKAARAEVFDLDTMVANAADSLTSGLEGLFGDFISGTKSAKEAFSDFAQSVLMDIGKMIGKLLVQLAIQSLLSAFSGGTSTAASGALSGLMNAGVNHSGGIAGSGNRRRLAPAGWFSGAPKYHTGGVVGLKANEVPIVAERGEEVLTESDPRHRKNQGKKSSVKEEKQPINVINMLDNSAIARAALESPEGERMVLNIIKANKGSLNM